MTAQEIETILKTLKVNSRGHIIGKSRAIDAIQSMHLTEVDNKLTDVRIFVAKRPISKFDGEEIDKFIYNIQTQ